MTIIFQGAAHVQMAPVCEKALIWGLWSCEFLYQVSQMLSLLCHHALLIQNSFTSAL